MQGSVPEKPLVKVQFYDPEIGYENIWALPLGGDTYRLENSPFFIYDVSLGDVVAAIASEDGVLEFLRVVSRSGNRTLRARSDNLLRDSRLRSRVVAALSDLKCRTEEHGETLLSISIPPGADLERVTFYLNKQQLDWEYGYPAGSNT